MSRKTKYFVVQEGSDRGILRNRFSDAQEKKKRMKQHCPEKNVYIFEAKRMREAETGK